MKQNVSVDQTQDNEGSVSRETFLTELSVAILQLYVEEQGKQHEGGVTILTDGKAAVRYAEIVPGVKRVTVCLEEEDDDTMFKDKHLLELVRDKLTSVMYSHRKHCDRFDVIDLDVGSACVATYLDTAMNGIADGGLLLVTCHDTSISTGQAPDSCYRLYGALSLKMSEEAVCDEMTVRVLLKCIESHANRHGRYIEPLLSVNAGSCVRVFLRVRISPVVCKQSLSKLSWVYQCGGCGSLTLHPLGVAVKTSVERNVFKFSLPRGPPVSQLCQHCQQPHHFLGVIPTCRSGASYLWTKTLCASEARCKTNLQKWGLLPVDEDTMCECGQEQNPRHLLVCPSLDEPSTLRDVVEANAKAISVANYWKNCV